MSTDTAVATVPAVLIHPSPRGAHGVGLLPRPGISIPVSCFHPPPNFLVRGDLVRHPWQEKTPLLLDEMPEPMDRPFVSELGDMLEMGPT
jgi:hypothetical protein